MKNFSDFFNLFVRFLPLFHCHVNQHFRHHQEKQGTNQGGAATEMGGMSLYGNVTNTVTSQQQHQVYCHMSHSVVNSHHIVT